MLLMEQRTPLAALAYEIKNSSHSWISSSKKELFPSLCSKRAVSR
jgi:hypothetical protein